MKKIISTKWKLLVLIGWALFIFYMSISKVTYLEGEGGSSFGLNNHLMAYFVLAILLFFVLKEYNIKHTYLVAISIAFFYGFGMEAIQVILPWRNFSIYDSMSNLLGSFGIFILKPYYRFRNKQVI